MPMLDRSLHGQTNPLARLHALWTLAALNRVDAAVVNDVVADPHPACASTPCASRRRSSHIRPAIWISTARLVTLAERPRDPRPAASGAGPGRSLSTRSRPRSMPWAQIAAKDADDPWMRLAILSGLAESSLAFIPLVRSDSVGTGPGPTAVASRRDRGRSPAPDRAGRSAGNDRVTRGSGQAKSRPGRSVDALTMLAGLADGPGAVRPAASTP